MAGVIEIAFEREGHARTRIIRITTASNPLSPEYCGARPSAPSAPSATGGNPMGRNGFEPDPLRTVNDSADAGQIAAMPSVRANPLESRGGNAADDADASFPAQTGPSESATSTWRTRL